MRNMLFFGGTLFLLCGASGCGTDVHDKLAKDTLGTLQDMQRTLKQIKDGDTAEKYGDKLVKDYSRLQTLRKDAVDFRGSLTKEESERLQKKYGEEYAETIQGINKEWERLEGIEKKVAEEAKAKTGAGKTKEKGGKTKEAKGPLTVLKNKGFPYPNWLQVRPGA